MFRTKKLIAIVAMTLAMLMFAEIPVGAVAPVFNSQETINKNTIVESSEIETEIEDAGYIISEMNEKRTENSKTFRLSNGTCMVAQYNMPVHYKSEKGKWVDYDNTLSVTEEDCSVVETQSLLDGEATADSVATFTIANNDVKNNKKQVLKNKRSNTSMSFAQQASQENMVIVDNKKHKVSWGYKDIEPKNAKHKDEKKTRIGDDRFTVLDNLTSTVVYESAYKNVDIECITTPVGVKENIVLNKKSATNKFVSTYDIGELRAEKLNDREIALYNQNDKIEYFISALYMFDANNETSESIVLNILENANGKLVVEIVADEEWLSSKDRKYPVTIDPTFSYGQDWGDVQCTYIDSANPNTAYGYGSSTGYTGTVYTGTYGAGTYRSLMKINNLPTLNKGDMIVEAKVQLPLYSYDLYDDAYVGIYEAESSWNQSTATWNNKPSCSNLLVDYCNAYDSLNNGVWCSWDITKLVKQWYNGEANNEDCNNGFYLKMVNESINQQCVGFYSSNYPLDSDVRPVFKLAYRNNKGIESHWSYTSFSVGEVGTAYINDYSGALIFELPIASTADPYMFAGVSYVYNSYMANTKYSKHAPYFGKGWRMNMQQTLLPSTNYGLTGDDAKKYPYVYTDADGTEHYFMETIEDGETKYKDEDGLDLELTVRPEQNSTRYLITTKDKSKLYFYRAGYLNRIEDPYGNKQQVSYIGTQITTISDKTGNIISVGCNDNKFVDEIKDPSNRITTFEYDSSNRVTKVNYPGNKYAAFTYLPNGLIETISDNDEYKIKFTYDGNGTKSVSSVQEYGKGNALGQKITFDRTNYNETIIRTPGVDGLYGDSNNNDCVTTCQFDNYGRLTGAYSKTAGGSDLGAESLTYTAGSVNSSGSNINTINKVSKHHNLGANAVNYARNTSFETTASWTASSIFGGAEYSTAFDTTQKLYGQKSLKVTTTSYTDDGGARRYQDITNLTVGDYYTLSGYLKVTSLSQLAPSDSGAFIAATSYTSSGSEHYFSEYITEATDASINNGWRRVNVTFKVPTGTTKVRLTAGIRGAKGTVYFDAIQVEYGKNASSYNMVQNASFESNSDHIPSYWSNYRDLDFGDSKDGIAQRAHEGSVSFSIKGDVTKSKALYQEIPVSGAENDTYILSGWAKTTTAIPVDNRNNRFRLSVHVVYSDGSTEVKNPPNFNTTITDWQYSSYAFTLSDGTSATKTPIAIRVFLTYALQGNRAYFDDIQLIKEPAQSYTYDEDGNLISVLATAKQNTSYEYNADQKIESYTDPKEYEYKYTYNDKGSLESYTNARGVKSTFDYDERGSVKYTATVSGAKNKIETYQTTEGLSKDSSTYSVVITDQKGNDTTSVYNSKKGTLQSTADAKTTMSYAYEVNNDTLLTVTQTGSTENEAQSSAQVHYGYDNSLRNLTSIQTPSSKYEFTYDAFGNQTSVKAGDKLLASYEYFGNSGLLKRMTYDDGDSITNITYTYDKYGNIRTKNMNGTTVYEGLADKTGVVTKVLDHNNNLQYNYVYDSTERLVSSTRTDITNNSRVAMFEYNFDLNNNITKLSALTPYGSNTTQHTYIKDNLPSISTFNNGKSLTYSYNTVNQLNKVSINTATPIEILYTYDRWKDSDKSYDNITNLMKTEIGGGFGFRYTYDEHNNITKIYENVTSSTDDTTGTLAHQYTYDYLDQLIEAIDYNDNKKYVYTYDNAGNILSEKVYNNETGTEISSNAYTYSNGDWGDVLTAYNGQAITYDEIGNPLSYRNGMTFSWSNGRRLDSLTKNDKTINYTYDDDGRRLAKTVDGVKYTYLYEDGLLVQETRGNQIFDYSYDANGNIRMLKYRSNPTGTANYVYYALNSRGDVIGLYDSNGALLAKYNYDPWGNMLSVTNVTGVEITSSSDIANLQPFRYRGYYYDAESGFYYLQNRYYDPVTHRFINADDISLVTASPTTLTDKNLYAYCDNNPVVRTDIGGEFWNYVIGGVVGAVIGGVSAAISGGDWKAIALGAGVGAVGGLLAASGIPVGFQIAAGGLLSGGNNLATQTLIEGKSLQEVDWFDVGIDTAIGAGTSALSYGVTYKSAKAADKVIRSGASKVAKGQQSLLSGSRYGKGAIKKGTRIMSKGIKQRNTVRGVSSVVGSSSGGILTSIKSFFKRLFR